MRSLTLLAVLAVILFSLTVTTSIAANQSFEPTTVKTADGDPLIDGIDWDDWLESIGQTFGTFWSDVTGGIYEDWLMIDGIDWDDWLENELNGGGGGGLG
jgi:hypothetical protein